MDSTNGTYLNGGELRGEAPLNDMDEIRIGDTVLRFELTLDEGTVPDAADRRGGPAHRHRPPARGQRGLATSRGRRCSRSPTGWAARRPARSPRGWRSRRSSDADEADAAPEELLRRTAQDANREIFDLAQGDSSRSGMGTTLTAALVHGDEISFGHVGDSRAYVFREGKLKQITNDHSLVEELRRQGRLTRDQAAEHPQRSVITRALGPEPQVDVDTMTFSARPATSSCSAPTG